eukprot:COSAG06_NODE_1043_length_10979_cov_54.806250_3_plen_107_part_00
MSRSRRGRESKRRSWDAALLHRAGSAPAGAEFTPFSLEASGVRGPTSRRFFAKCLYLADDDRDIGVNLANGAEPGADMVVLFLCNECPLKKAIAWYPYGLDRLIRM